MFSKAGRDSVEKFQILSESKEILEGKPKTTHPGKPPVNIVEYVQVGGKIYPREVIKYAMGEIAYKLAEPIRIEDDEIVLPPVKITKFTEDSPKRKRASPEPFAKMISRQKREKLAEPKVLNIDRGKYNVNYECVFKKVNPLDFSKLSPRGDIMTNRSSYMDPELISSQTQHDLPSFDRIKKRAPNVVPLDKQTGRIDLLESAERSKQYTVDKFAISRWPQNYSQFNKTPSVDIGKYLPRKDMIEEHEHPVYEPNKDKVLKRLNLYDNLMATKTKRKYKVKRSEYSIEMNYEYDQYVKNNKSVIYSPPKPILTFNKMLPRGELFGSKVTTYRSRDSSPVPIQEVQTEQYRSYDQKRKRNPYLGL